MFDRIFTRWRVADDRRFDDALNQLSAGQGAVEHLARTDAERAEHKMARWLGTTLAPLREPSPAVRERVWRDVQARIATSRRTGRSGTLTMPTEARRWAVPARRLPLALAGAAVLLLLVLVAPLLLRQQDAPRPQGSVAALLRSAGAATLTVPPGQVLHCTRACLQTRLGGEQ